MQRNDIDQERERDGGDSTENTESAPETAEHPVPGVHHKLEPDAENIMPAEDGPGTF